MDWVDDFDVLSPNQKGFLPYDGAFENNCVLHQRIQKARAEQGTLCLFSLDLKNAFGSVPLDNLLTAISEAGMGGTYAEILSDLICGASTQILSAGELSDPLDIPVGLRQGDPLSEIIFDIYIDPLVRRLQGSASQHQVLAFVDDLNLLGDSPEALQALVGTAYQYSFQMGLTINPKKCYSLHLGPNPMSCKGTQFFVNGTPVPFLKDGESALFLGKKIGFGITEDSVSMDSFIEEGRKILTSFLAPWQRVDAAKSFLYPSFNYAQRTGAHKKGEWDRLDKEIRPLFKKTLSLPTNASSSYLHGNANHGLFGIPLSAEDADITAIDSAFKLLTSIDCNVTDLAWVGWLVGVLWHWIL